MSLTKYSYSKGTHCPNGLITDKLTREIRATDITKALSHISVLSDVINIWFKEVLTVEEQTTLSTTVTAHDGVATPGVDEPVNVDGRPIVHTTPRKVGTYTYFTSSGDDQTDGSKVGGAVPWSNKATFWMPSGTNTKVKYIDFNTVVNETYIYEGVAMWKDAINDEIKVEIVPKVTTYVGGTDTNFAIDPTTGLIIPAAGTGNIIPDDINLVESPLNEFGKREAGLWDADYNTETKAFENMVPNVEQKGRYNMFTVAGTLNRFGNCISMLGAGFIALDSNDSSQFGHNMRFKITATTNFEEATEGGTPHDWWANVNLILYRKKTC